MASSHNVHGVAPAPPGQVANFVNPPTKMGSNIVLRTVMLFFVTLCVGVRLYTRQFITHQLGLDDCKHPLIASLCQADASKYKFMHTRLCEFKGQSHKLDLTDCTITGSDNYVFGSTVGMYAFDVTLNRSIT